MKKNYTLLIQFLFVLTFTVSLNAQNEFITTWNTLNTGTSGLRSITIPTSGGGYNYDVDWNNDGTFDDFGVTGDITHTYFLPGTYTVAIRGDFPRIHFNNAGDRLKIIEVNQWGNIAWTSMANAFYGCGNLSIPATDAPDLSNVTSMSSMFRNATNLNSSIGHWDVSNVSNMTTVFLSATSFNQDLSNWNVTNSINMAGMFNNASVFNQDLSSWNISNVNSMVAMFSGVTLSINNYDNILIAWNNLNLQTNVNFNGGNSKFCAGTAARANLITSFNWTVSDSGTG